MYRGTNHFGGVKFEEISVYSHSGFGQLSVARTRQHIMNDELNHFALSIPVKQPNVISQAGISKKMHPRRFQDY
jgi:hypothetical protein